MYLLHIEHPVADFAAWRAAFDRDPASRQRYGVRRYWISRPVDDDRYVIIDLVFDTEPQAAALLVAMHTVCNCVEGTLIFDPITRIARLEAEHTY